jgi:hypothetical protein
MNLIKEPHPVPQLKRIQNGVGNIKVRYKGGEL